MIRSRILVRTAAWAAWAAMLMATLAPAVSHALAARDGTWWAEVCSAQGARRLPAGSGPALPDPSALQAPCGYCTAPATDVAVPQPETAWRAPDVGSTVVSCRGSCLPNATARWSFSQPRAPPAQR
jgi:hypothetical protein